jgi:hypothetical protein
MSIENNLERIAAALEAIAVSMKGPDVTLVPLYPDTVPAIVVPKPKKAPKAEAPAVPVAPPAAPIKLEPGESVAFAGGVLSNPAGAPPVAPPPAPVPAPVPAAPAPAPVVQMTAEQLNAALVAEVGRIGAQEPIAQTIRDMGYNGLREMPTSMYGELLNRVKAL